MIFNDSFFLLNHIMWRAHVLAMCSLRNSSWHHMRDTALIDRYFYTMIYGTGMKRRSNAIGSKEIRRAAFPKPPTEEFRDGCMTALQCTSYEAEVTGCDKRMSEKRHQMTESLSLHPVGIGCVCGRDVDSAPARCRSRVSWWVKGIPDRIETQSRVRNEMLRIQILALASNHVVDAS